MTIGIPLAMVKQPEGGHEVILNFSGVRWTMDMDGELLDNRLPVWLSRKVKKLEPPNLQGFAGGGAGVARRLLPWLTLPLMNGCHRVIHAAEKSPTQDVSGVVIRWLRCQVF